MAEAALHLFDVPEKRGRAMEDTAESALGEHPFDYHCSCGRKLTATTHGMSKQIRASILRTWLASHQGRGHCITSATDQRIYHRQNTRRIVKQVSSFEEGSCVA